LCVAGVYILCKSSGEVNSSSLDHAVLDVYSFQAAHAGQASMVAWFPLPHLVLAMACVCLFEGTHIAEVIHTHTLTHIFRTACPIWGRGEPEPTRQLKA
uniref:Uncharacterized protein n=1 Tax=Scleropages formosus TaxID=113540 RepID=A0A8C9W2V3_SCLFO